ncbi:hypothetical protein LTR37_004934 [Vermiconidia calcicola]|uniref:Uncharacterized protein n=1 Tax=Vermiconidia calcicola TaxID=1690605 RepID=A0ACC3NKN2_9PEZI|nr:hypothetical protein LTR37_004934 [Vermiconidia calcicola]
MLKRIFAALEANVTILWSASSVSNYTSLHQHAYPLGNGRLAALLYGEAGQEKLSLNRDSLWSGGPFANNTGYRGGNPLQERHQYLPGIRDWIWQNGTGNVTKLMGETTDYGSYQVLGNLSVAIEGVAIEGVAIEGVAIEGVAPASDYRRSLDLETGVHSTSFNAGGAFYLINAYCSNPDDVCVYDLTSTHALPRISISMEQTLSNASLISTSCSNGQVRLTGTTEVDPGFDSDIGMKFDSITKIIGSTLRSNCDGDVLTVPASGHKELTLVLAAGTNYDQTHGTPEYNYSFRGADPGLYVQNAINVAASKGARALLSTHVADYSALASAFTLELPDTRRSSGTETAELIARYANPNNTDRGDPYLENLIFDSGRHLFISSGRSNSLPPNLQGRWANELENAWSADYHANINLQMNYWLTDQTGLGSLQAGLWDYMAETWAPRGTETAQLLYDAPGWVVHNEMNIFGYTAMKTGEASWADYPISAAWMMQHVWDHYEYSQDLEWLKRQGYPVLLKPIAQFWLSQLQRDQYFKDGTLVVNPCDSPEHPPTTFGCAHWQQLIFQVFETTLESASLVGEDDYIFMNELQEKLSLLDKGYQVGDWGQVQEWKLDIDLQNDTHRHLSHLVGWHPGWSISSYLGGYTNSSIQEAVATSLYSRGVGIGPDANSGWEKVWRSACWARLNNSMEAYYELRLTIYENWAPNALSMYSGKELPFQIDANFGFPGAVLSMLVVDLPLLHEYEGIKTVVLGPAIPAAWGGGCVKGLRLRGGGSVDFSWDMSGVVTRATLYDRANGGVKLVNREGILLAS